MQQYSNYCHTWIYKKIDALTDDELIHLIDGALDERTNRWYMKCTDHEYALKLKKIANTSYGDEIEKYIDINNGISRYNEAIKTNQLYIDNLIKAKSLKNRSIIYNEPLFEKHPIMNNYVFMDMDKPFKFNGIYNNHVIYTNPDDVILFLWKYNTDENKKYIEYNGVFGMNKDIEDTIYSLFKKHDNQILIEFSI